MKQTNNTLCIDYKTFSNMENNVAFELSEMPYVENHTDVFIGFLWVNKEQQKCNS